MQVVSVAGKIVREAAIAPVGSSVPRPSLSLVLPAHNEAPVIQQSVREAVAALEALAIDFEVIVVDDGSTDDTASIAQAEAQRQANVRVISLPRNAGYGAALRAGFAT